MRMMAMLALFLMPTLAQAATTAAPDRIDPACKALVSHIPDADVAYQPGVDVHGKPVAPADLDGGSNIKLPATIQIPLTADLLKTLNLPAGSIPFNPGSNSDIYLGMLTVQGDKVLYNGQPLSDSQQDNLAVLCLHPDQAEGGPADIKSH